MWRSPKDRGIHPSPTSLLSYRHGKGTNQAGDPLRPFTPPPPSSGACVRPSLLPSHAMIHLTPLKKKKGEETDRIDTVSRRRKRESEATECCRPSRLPVVSEVTVKASEPRPGCKGGWQHQEMPSSIPTASGLAPPWMWMDGVGIASGTLAWRWDTRPLDHIDRSDTTGHAGEHAAFPRACDADADAVWCRTGARPPLSQYPSGSGSRRRVSPPPPFLSPIRIRTADWLIN